MHLSLPASFWIAAAGGQRYSLHLIDEAEAGRYQLVVGFAQSMPVDAERVDTAGRLKAAADVVQLTWSVLQPIDAGTSPRLVMVTRHLHGVIVEPGIGDTWCEWCGADVTEGDSASPCCTNCAESARRLLIAVGTA